ncbi:cupin domain-containing protein [Promicromonospora sp. MEB111]|uniref:cupin domain-containing protein n=1 Tax=Promicromonospora sp. MEB111 TaxID=3040301 RepID=UPI002549D92A|nr:cupin domain-containing protein [Promicromonospora sp. MEB111]
MTQDTTQQTDDRLIHLGASGSTIEVLASVGETDGALSLYRWRLAPTSRGPAPHFHTTFGETFVVEDGEVDYFDGTAWRTLRAGGMAHSPRGTVHGLRKERDEPATLLMVLSPGVRREDYFAQLATVREADMDRLHEAHDNHFVDEDR